MKLVAEAVRAALARLGPEKSHLQIAQELGYDRGNMLSMIKSGHASIPFKSLGLFSEVLGIDLGHLVRLYIEDNATESAGKLGQAFRDCNLAVLSSNEVEILNRLRAENGGQPLSMAE
jgi:hypothetical protein